MPRLISLCSMRFVAAEKSPRASLENRGRRMALKNLERPLIKSLRNDWSGLFLSGLSQFEFCGNRQVASGDRVNMPHQSSIRLKPRKSGKGFSLVELLAVIAIIALMFAMLGPALGSFGHTASRKGAVSIVMNTLEQARAAALEQNCSVNVLFWRRDFPDRDAIIVVRDASPWILDDNGM
ncbi:MAG TPA: prepilin-type N-terminal cleavage/methylation domain-containing protein, partial [Chthoniobacterales bacterium]|nr:prepilin-type N-terminal cleavage/methylation domain-containing protein [Chthoniobacterales bacterium]